MSPVHRRPGWRYHLVTVRSVLLFTVLMTLIIVAVAAAVGIVAGRAFHTGPDVVPGRGVTVTPFPPATHPVTLAPTPIVAPRT